MKLLGSVLSKGPSGPFFIALRSLFEKDRMLI